MAVKPHEVVDLLAFVNFFDQYRHARCPQCGYASWRMPDRVLNIETDSANEPLKRAPLSVLAITCRQDRCGHVRFVSVDEIKDSRSWLKFTADRLRRKAGEQSRALTADEEAYIRKAESLPVIC